MPGQAIDVDQEGNAKADNRKNVGFEAARIDEIDENDETRGNRQKNYN